MNYININVHEGMCGCGKMATQNLVCYTVIKLSFTNNMIGESMKQHGHLKSSQLDHTYTTATCTYEESKSGRIQYILVNLPQFVFQEYGGLKNLVD